MTIGMSQEQSVKSAKSADTSPISAFRFSDGLLMAFHRDATFITLDRPMPCAACHVLHCWFVNRLGSTLCYACDQAGHRPASPRPASLPPCNPASLPLSSSVDLLSTSARLRGLSNKPQVVARSFLTGDTLYWRGRQTDCRQPPVPFAPPNETLPVPSPWLLLLELAIIVAAALALLWVLS